MEAVDSSSSTQALDGIRGDAGTTRMAHSPGRYARASTHVGVVVAPMCTGRGSETLDEWYRQPNPGGTDDYAIHGLRRFAHD